MTAGMDPAQAVASYYERVDADDVDGILELFAPDAVYRRPGYEPIRGRTALADFYRNRRVIASGKHTVTQLIHADDRIAVQGTFEGVLKDGSAQQLAFADFYRAGEQGFTERTTYFYAPLV